MKRGQTVDTLFCMQMGCCVIEMFTLSSPYAGQYSNDFTLMHRISKVTRPLSHCACVGVHTCPYICTRTYLCACVRVCIDFCADLGWNLL